MAAKVDDENDLIDSMDILTDLDVLDSEPDWRILKDSDNLNKYIKQTSKKASDDTKSEGESHD